MRTRVEAADSIQYGFKRISLANLLKHDDHPSYRSDLRGDKWVRECLKPQLEPSVPDEVAWKSMVFLRNRCSHATSATLLDRHSTIAQLTYIAELLNGLFK